MNVTHAIQWPKLIYTKTAVKNAGKVIAHSPIEECAEPLKVLNNWRAAHAYPLYVIKELITSVYNSIGGELSITHPLISQRIKRLPAIKSKLQRSNIHLHKMHDIAGCRVVLPDLKTKSKMAMALEEDGLFSNQIVKLDNYSYAPRQSGYRGIHIIYRLRDEEENDFLVEVQLRTALQHSWATAVEMAGTLLGDSDRLKSGDGPKDWLQFFWFVSNLFAHKEGGAWVGDIHQIRSEAIDLERRLRVIEQFKALSLLNLSYQWDELQAENGYHLLSFEPVKDTLSIRSYEHQDLRRALNTFFELDKNEKINTTFVGTFSPYELNRLYPNYFLEASQFVENLESVLN